MSSFINFNQLMSFLFESSIDSFNSWIGNRSLSCKRFRKRVRDYVTNNYLFLHALLKIEESFKKRLKKPFEHCDYIVTIFHIIPRHRMTVEQKRSHPEQFLVRKVALACQLKNDVIRSTIDNFSLTFRRKKNGNFAGAVQLFCATSSMKKKSKKFHWITSSKPFIQEHVICPEIISKIFQ